MVKATTLQYEYRTIINTVHSDFKKAISVMDGDSYINRAIDDIQENLTTMVEKNATLEAWLADFEVVGAELSYEQKDEYSFYAKFKDDHYKLLRQTATLCKKDCDNPREIVLQYRQRDDLSESLLRDPFKGPNINWGESFYNIAQRGIHIYTECDTEVKKVKVDYLKVINYIATPSLLDKDSKCYEDSAGVKHCKDIDLNIHSRNPIWRKVVSLAALMTLRDMGEGGDYQTLRDQILYTDKIYIT